MNNVYEYTITLFPAVLRQYGYSELSDISVNSLKVMSAELLFAEKWPPTKAICGHLFPQKQLLQGNAQMSPLHAHPQFSLANTSFGCALANCTDLLQTHLAKTCHIYTSVGILN